MTIDQSFTVYTRTSEEVQPFLTIDFEARQPIDTWFSSQDAIDGIVQSIAREVIIYAQRQASLWGLTLPCPVHILDQRAYLSLEESVMDIRADRFRIMRALVTSIRLTAPLMLPPPPKALPPARPSRKEQIVEQNDSNIGIIEELVRYRRKLRQTHPDLYEDPQVAELVEGDIAAQAKRIIVRKTLD